VFLSRLRRSISDINVAWDHLDLIEGVHAFRSNLFLLDLEVYSSTFKLLKVPTQTAWCLKLWTWLTMDKILWRSMKKIGCKHLMLKTWGCRGGVSRSNGGGCRLWSGHKRQIQHLKVPPWSAKKLKKKKHSTLKDSILNNSYRLGFFLFRICQSSIQCLIFLFRSILSLISLFRSNFMQLFPC